MAKKKKKYVFELTDIYEDIEGKSPRQIDKIIEKNIKYILKREKLWKSNYEIIIPPGGAIWEFTDDFYQVDFVIMDNKKQEVIFHGTCYGLISHGEIRDMTVELKRL